MLKSGIPTRCDICIQRRSYLQTFFNICRLIFLADVASLLKFQVLAFRGFSTTEKEGYIYIYDIIILNLFKVPYWFHKGRDGRMHPAPPPPEDWRQKDARRKRWARRRVGFFHQPWPRRIGRGEGRV